MLSYRIQEHGKSTPTTSRRDHMDEFNVGKSHSSTMLPCHHPTLRSACYSLIFVFHSTIWPRVGPRQSVLNKGHFIRSIITLPFFPSCWFLAIPEKLPILFTYGSPRINEDVAKALGLSSSSGEYNFPSPSRFLYR